MNIRNTLRIIACNLLCINALQVMADIQSIDRALEYLRRGDMQNALVVTQNALEVCCPQIKRVEELKKRVEKAQQEVAEKLASRTNVETPVLSFIMPCYNRAKVVHETIKTIYDQNISVPFEIVVVDDASTDNSYEVLKTFEATYSNFFAYRNPVNKKAPTTRNVAIAYARGKYICNADSDDLFEPNTVEPMLQQMIRTDADVMFFQELRFFNDSDKKPVQVVASNSANNVINFDSMIKNNPITVSAGNRLFTKDSWLNSGGYLEDRGHDSWSFSLKLLASGYAGHIYPGSGYLHRFWSDKSNMWWDDHKDKVNDVSPMRALKESLEFFDKKSQTALKNYHNPNGDFIHDLKGFLQTKKLQMIPDSQLHTLLQAYWHENRSNYGQALAHYQQAIGAGVTNSNVYLRAARLALHMDNRHLAQKMLESAKKCALTHRGTDDE